MKQEIVTIVLLIILLVVCRSWATDIDFYEDGVIEIGDVYRNVSVYDTPPDHTTVDMTGGIVDLIATYDESTINISEGTINTLNSYQSSKINLFGISSTYWITANDNSQIKIFDDAWLAADLFIRNSASAEISGGYFNGMIGVENSGTISVTGGDIDRISVEGFGTVNLTGGFVKEDLTAADSGIINIYGYSLFKSTTGGIWDYGFVSGEWQNGETFEVSLYDSETYSHVLLHEIPEPGTLFLLGLGSLLLRRKNRQ